MLPISQLQMLTFRLIHKTYIHPVGPSYIDVFTIRSAAAINAKVRGSNVAAAKFFPFNFRTIKDYIPFTNIWRSERPINNNSIKQFANGFSKTLLKQGEPNAIFMKSCLLGYQRLVIWNVD